MITYRSVRSAFCGALACCLLLCVPVEAQTKDAWHALRHAGESTTEGIPVQLSYSPTDVPAKHPSTSQMLFPVEYASRSPPMVVVLKYLLLIGVNLAAAYAIRRLAVPSGIHWAVSLLLWCFLFMPINILLAVSLHLSRFVGGLFVLVFIRIMSGGYIGRRETKRAIAANQTRDANGAQESLDRATRLLAKGSQVEAAAEFERVVRFFPNTDAAGMARTYLGPPTSQTHPHDNNPRAIPSRKTIVSPPTHYDTLCVARDAPPNVIEASYIALIRRHNRGTDERSKKMCETIHASLIVLSDPLRRAAYDRWLDTTDLD